MLLALHCRSVPFAEDVSFCLETEQGRQLNGSLLWSHERAKYHESNPCRMKSGPDINETVTWSDFVCQTLEFPSPISSPALQQLMLHAIPKAVRAGCSLSTAALSRNQFFMSCLESLYQLLTPGLLSYNIRANILSVH